MKSSRRSLNRQTEKKKRSKKKSSWARVWEGEMDGFEIVISLHVDRDQIEVMKWMGLSNRLRRMNPTYFPLISVGVCTHAPGAG